MSTPRWIRLGSYAGLVAAVPFPAGKDVELGLADDYSVLFLAADEARVSEALWSKVVRLCSNIRSHTKEDV